MPSANILEQASPVDVAKHIWHPSWLKWSVAISRKGAFTRDGIPTAQALTEDVAAGLPGTPMAIPSPGHTGGHCSFVVDGVLVSGDALVTGHPVAPRAGPAAVAPAVQPRPGRLRAQPGGAGHARDRGARPRARPGVAGSDPGGRRKPHCRPPALGERFVTQEEDRGQAQPAAQHERRHQDLVVEIGVVRRFPPTADERAHASPASERQPGGGEEQPPYGRLRNRTPPPPPLCATACDQPIGRDGPAGCGRRIRCGMRPAPAAAAPLGRRSRPGRAGSGVAPG